MHANLDLFKHRFLDISIMKRSNLPCALLAIDCNVLAFVQEERAEDCTRKLNYTSNKHHYEEDERYYRKYTAYADHQERYG